LNFSNEWQDSLNPFNSMKVLLWRECLEGCARGEYLPPIGVAIDPTTRCNFNCIWCNAWDIRQEQFTMTEEHAVKLINFLFSWGVKSNCIAGGGEPTLSPAFDVLLDHSYELGISNSVITNGSCLDDKRIALIAKTCKWIGFSMDAGSAETYCKVKGLKEGLSWFSEVLGNISRLRKEIDRIGSSCRIGYKFLIHPYNQGEILRSAVTAKIAGAHDVQFRPVGWDNLTVTKGKEPLVFNVQEINRQLDEALKLTDSEFKVYAVRHKFNPDLSLRRAFSKCWAVSLHPTFSADGNVYICFDRRGDKDLILCRHDPDPKEVLNHWNSQKHKDLMSGIDVNLCPRCTFGGYNEIVEKVIIQDSMCMEHV
jgi:sulfatase maturation enzyme AslB (radical SAM superfamily)